MRDTLKVVEAGAVVDGWIMVGLYEWFAVPSAFRRHSQSP